MTIQEMIDELEEVKNFHGGDIEINFGGQPRYPFEYSIERIIFDDKGDEDPRAIILEGSQLRYGKKAWWDEY